MARQRHRWDPVCDPPQRLVEPRPVDPSGILGPTKSQALRVGGPRSRWRRTTPGLFVPSDVEDTVPEQRILEMYQLLRGRGAVTGWASLRVQGASFCDGLAADGFTRLPVPLVTGPHDHRRPFPGVEWMQDRLGDEEIWIRQGMRVTRPERATFDRMRKAADLWDAVAGMDMAAAAGLTSVRRMTGYVETRAGWQGTGLVRRALTLSSDRSRSRAETDTRMIWELIAGLPRPLVNQEVFSTDGRFLGVADLLDLEAGLVGEYDGADHAGAVRRSKDATREGRMRDFGLEVFRVTGHDLRDRAALAQRMQAARSRALWLPPERRRWTIEPPPGWEVGTTLDERLDHQDFLRTCQRDWERGQSL